MSIHDKKGETNMTTTAQKWGNSIGVRIPKRLAQKYGISNGSEVKFTESEKGIFIEPIEGEPTLDELLARVTDENRHDYVDWGKPEGNEVW